MNSNEIQRISDDELSNVIEELMEGNDLFQKELVFEVVKKIIDFPFDTNTTIAELINYNPKEKNIDPLTQGVMFDLIENIFEKFNIKLEEATDVIGGLAYYISFKKVNRE